ncbi:hypothetical protein VTN31DRAFT_6855 [Thermomyces dupontii]|uniref:uncharacterized protein n=1 Tax=Talaromyces thermophilus TaxID=28565 RepID=UPI00374458E1
MSRSSRRFGSLNYKKPFKSMSVALQMKCCGFGERETAPDPQERKWKILKERAVKKGKEPEFDARFIEDHQDVSINANNAARLWE